MAGVRERGQCQAWPAWCAAESLSRGQVLGSPWRVCLSDRDTSSFPQCLPGTQRDGCGLRCPGFLMLAASAALKWGPGGLLCGLCVLWGSVREGTWPLHPTSTSLAGARASLPGKSWVVCLGYVHLGEDFKQVREPPLLPALCFAASPHSNCQSD